MHCKATTHAPLDNKNGTLALARHLAAGQACAQLNIWCNDNSVSGNVAGVGKACASPAALRLTETAHRAGAWERIAIKINVTRKR